MSGTNESKDRAPRKQRSRTTKASQVGEVADHAAEAKGYFLQTTK
jgi:hypothetical protein